MQDLELLLQERLEQLEVGEPLEACLADMPEDQAELLKLAAALGELPYPVSDSRTVAVQRSRLLSLTRRKMKMKNQETQKNPIASLLERLLRPKALAGAVVALVFICAFVSITGTGIMWWSSRDTEVAQAPTLSPTEKPHVVIQNPFLKPEEGTPHVSFLPLASVPTVHDPQSATLIKAQGVVKVQNEDGDWAVVEPGHRLTAGQRVRTGAMSSTQLAFFDGSQAQLGPETEVSVDELDAQRDGPRVVVLTQWIGESQHDVVPAQGDASRYEVHTPSASGAAKGTSFAVLVTPALLTRFSVDEGAVAVSGQGATVLVRAGQWTSVNSDEPPREPGFRITGEGEVSQTGPTWVIAGQSFVTHDETVIVGDPQVGDWVYVEARLVDDAYLGDRIVLLRRAVENRFSITARVDAIEETTWTIAGQVISVTAETDVQPGIEVEDLVNVRGLVLAEGALLAEQIRLVEEEPGTPFSFVGVVQSMASDEWTISGVTVAISDTTEIDAGLEVGDVVQAQGWIVEDDVWLAESIERVEEEREFEFTGIVESVNPWVVSGIAFETRDWTEIDADIEVGDRVKVEGQILEDGVWVASEIELLDSEEHGIDIVFVGTASSTDPWIVNGIPLIVDDETEIEDGISAGDLVRVTARLRPDGTLLALEIERIDVEPGQGCFTVSAVVIGINGDELDLSNWPPIVLGDGTLVTGEIQVGSVILMVLCVDDEGAVTVVSIIVI
jgi:hypothetical protein